MKRKSALIFISAAGFNETEYKTVRAALLRQGVSVFIASDTAGTCIGESGLKVQPDVKLFNIHAVNYDAFILTGGEGVHIYWDNELLRKAVQDFFQSDKMIAAICGAPVILAKAGIMKGVSAVCYKEYLSMLEMEGASIKEAPVVADRNIITAMDDTCAPAFAEKIIEFL